MWLRRDGGCGAGVAVGHSRDGHGLGCCRDGVLCPLFHAGAVGQWRWVPVQGHLAGSWHCQSSLSLSHQLRQQGQLLPPAPSTCLLQAPILATSECCGLKIPQITGEGAAGSVQGAWAGEEQAALAHRGSGQAVLLPVPRLCHTVPAGSEPTWVPRHPARGRGGLWTLQERCGYTGPPSLGTASIPTPSWTGAPRALPAHPARPWKVPPFRIAVARTEGTQGEGHLQLSVPMTTSRERPHSVREKREPRAPGPLRAPSPVTLAARRTQWGTAEGLHLGVPLPGSASACSLLFPAAWDRLWAAALQLHCFARWGRG